MKKLPILTILVLLFPILVFAGSEPLIILKNPSETSCPCNTIAFNVEITNNYGIDDIFLLSANIFNEHIQYSENPVSVKAQQNKTIYVFLTLPCEYYGSFKPYLQFHSQVFNSDYAVPLNIEINPCYDYSMEFVDYSPNNLSLKQHTGNFSLCQGANEKIPILINNKAGFDNLYFFGLKAPDWVTLIQENAIVPANDSRLIFLDAAIPRLTGTAPIRLDAISKRGEIANSLESYFIINDCYNIALELEEKKSSCQCNKEEYSAVVKNLGKETVKVNLGIEGPDWVKIDKNSILIGSNEEKIVKIKAEIPCDKKGKFEIKVKAWIEGKSDIKSEKTFVIDIQTKEKCSGKTKEFPIKTIIYTIIMFTAVLFVFRYLKKRKNIQDQYDKEPKVEKIKSEKTTLKKKIEEDKKEISPSGLPTQLGRWILNVVVLLILLIGLTALGIYFNQAVKFLKPYLTYIIVGIALLSVAIIILAKIKKRPRRKDERSAKKKVIKKEKKTTEKQIKGKKPIKSTKSILSIILVILILISVSFVAYYYKLFNFASAFFLQYYLYVLIGFGLLIFLIIIWKQFEKE